MSQVSAGVRDAPVPGMLGRGGCDLRREARGDLVRVETHFAGEQAHEPPRDDSTRQLLEVVALDGAQNGHPDLGPFGDLNKREPALLSRLL